MDPRTINDNERLIAAVKNTALIGVSRFLCTLEFASADSRYDILPSTYFAYPPREGKSLVSGEHMCYSRGRGCKPYVTCSNESNEC
jgi:hypothetical protein